MGHQLCLQDRVSLAIRQLCQVPSPRDESSCPSGTKLPSPADQRSQNTNGPPSVCAANIDANHPCQPPMESISRRGGYAKCQGKISDPRERRKDWSTKPLMPWITQFETAAGAPVQWHRCSHSLNPQLTFVLRGRANQDTKRLGRLLLGLTVGSPSVSGLRDRRVAAVHSRRSRERGLWRTDITVRIVQRTYRQRIRQSVDSGG